MAAINVTKELTTAEEYWQPHQTYLKARRYTHFNYTFIYTLYTHILQLYSPPAYIAAYTYTRTHARMYGSR